MIELRPITEIEELLRWRSEVLTHVFGSVPTSQVMEANRLYFGNHVSDGSHLALVAYVDGSEAGCGAICMYDEMPSPDNHSGRCAYLMNIYVRAPFRRRGVASRMVRALVEAAREYGCGKIYLETTDTARNLYRSLSFSDLKGYMKYEC